MTNIGASEQELRAALDAVLSVDKAFVQATLDKFEELEFVPLAGLHALERNGTGSVVVHFTPSRRVLKIAALFSDPDFSATVTYQMPRKYWLKKTEAAE